MQVVLVLKMYTFVKQEHHKNIQLQPSITYGVTNEQLKKQSSIQAQSCYITNCMVKSMLKYKNRNNSTYIRTCV